MRFGIVNASTLVSDADARTMAAAIDAQLKEDFCQDWRLAPKSCEFVPGGMNYTADPDLLAVILMDTIPVDGALAFHDEDQSGRIYALVGVKEILDAGGGILTAGSSQDSVAAAADHEVLEATLDPNCNQWVDGPIALGGKSWASIAKEACDPCQAEAYLKNGVLVSGYILPAWLDPYNKVGPFSKLGSCTAPLSVAPGGYGLVRDAPGSEQSVFGEAGNARPWRSGFRRWKRVPAAPAKSAA